MPLMNIAHTPTMVGLVSPLPPQLGGVVTVARWLLGHEDKIGCTYVKFDLTRPTDEAGGRLRMGIIGISSVSSVGSYRGRAAHLR